MKNNLYYTPTIEEFHVGFEYQFNHKDKGWIDFKFGGTDDWSILEIDMEIENNEIRVKYLNQSDIESLGWRFGTNDYVFPENKNVTYGQYKLLFNNNELEIIHLSGTLFRGIIKNKSELNKLMQQLNIK